jgi:hypothetical protein
MIAPGVYRGKAGIPLAASNSSDALEPKILRLRKKYEAPV